MIDTRHSDLLLNAIDNLRGYRCAEQGPFLAHVDAVWNRAVEVDRQLRGAVEALEAIADGCWNVGAPRDLSVREFARQAITTLAAPSFSVIPE